MREDIVKIRLQNELDIVLAYKRAKQLGEFVGLNLSNQTKFGTAVSEICRNVLEHVGEGLIKFSIAEQEQLYLEAIITDRGRGIPNLEEYLNRKVLSTDLKGCGIINSKKLSDLFHIESSFETGTKVTIRKKILPNHPPITNAIIKGWKGYFENEAHISPYEEIKKQNLQLMEMTEQLKEKNIQAEEQIQEIQRLNNELDKFAYTVSHDLKAPLNNIEGIVGIIEDGILGSDNDSALEACGMLKTQAIRMTQMISDILSYAKAGKASVVKNRVDINKLVAEVVATLKVPSRIKIIFDHLPSIIIEEIFLKQIFSNLISNAIKYHDKKSGIIRVKSNCTQSECVFSVEDDGPGINAEDLSRIFKIFETSSGSDKDSTGIGLNIVKSLVNKKGGKVWIESDGKHGSKFFFSWPQ